MRRSHPRDERVRMRERCERDLNRRLAAEGVGQVQVVCAASAAVAAMGLLLGADQLVSDQQASGKRR